MGEYVPVGAFVAVGGPLAAAATMALPDVLWVGALTPADRTARAWDAILAAVESLVANGTLPEKLGAHTMTLSMYIGTIGIEVDMDARIIIEIALPPLVSREGVPLALATALALEFTVGVSNAASDSGAWAQLVLGFKKLQVHVDAKGLPAAVSWLASHRASHYVAPRFRMETQNIQAGEVLQGRQLSCASSKTPSGIWESREAGNGPRRAGV